MRRNNLTDTIFRFFSKVRFRESGCWEWQAYKNPAGYGCFSDHQRFGGHLGAHRWVYLIFIGPIADGNAIDHLCRNHCCVNPLHLESVSIGENVLRGIGPCAENRRKTHCKRGHRLDEANIRRTKSGGRECIQCGREKCRKFRRIVCAIPAKNYREYRIKPSLGAP